MSKLSLVTYNCRGLNETSKRQKLFSWFEHEIYDIVFLQETFCTKNFESIFRSSWKGQSIIAATNSSHSRGVAILFKPGFEGDIVSSYTSDDGRVVIVNTSFKNDYLSFVSVYAPNSEAERVVFFEYLQKIVFENVLDIDNVIIAGDFNCCINLSNRFPVTKRSDKSI